LRVEFESFGGELVLRDYPDDVEPGSNPDWPGYHVFPELRPDTTGMSKKQAARLVREWRARRKSQLASKKRIDRVMGGPCAKETER
jgi:hypothetical protein